MGIIYYGKGKIKIHVIFFWQLVMARDMLQLFSINNMRGFYIMVSALEQLLFAQFYSGFPMETTKSHSN